MCQVGCCILQETKCGLQRESKERRETQDKGGLTLAVTSFKNEVEIWFTRTVMKALKIKSLALVHNCWHISYHLPTISSRDYMAQVSLRLE